MPAVFASRLNSSQKASVTSLVAACQKKDAFSLSFPLEEADFYTLYYLDHTVVSAAAFTMNGADICDCAAFTAPAYRNQGFFSRLFAKGLRRLPEETNLCFYTDGRCPDTQRTLDALGAECISREHMMELAPPQLAALAEHRSPESRTAREPSAISAPPAMSEQIQDGVLTLTWHGFGGCVSVACHSGSYYLYGLEIAPQFRGNGNGMRLLSEVAAGLSARKCMPVRLQVAGDNEAALSLYKKTGFRITETLFCYLY